jgi:hypothetical protein
MAVQLEIDSGAGCQRYVSEQRRYQQSDVQRTAHMPS